MSSKPKLINGRFINEIFANLPIGMAIVGDNGIPIKVNKELCDILEYSPDELKSMSFQVFTHMDDVQLDLKQFSRVINGDIISYSLKKRYITKSRKIIWAFLFVTLVKTEDGQFVLGIVIPDEKHNHVPAETAKNVSEEKKSKLDVIQSLAERVMSLPDKKLSTFLFCIASTFAWLFLLGGMNKILEIVAK